MEALRGRGVSRHRLWAIQYLVKARPPPHLGRRLEESAHSLPTAAMATRQERAGREETGQVAKQSERPAGLSRPPERPRQKLENAVATWDLACGHIPVNSSTPSISALLTKPNDTPILAGLRRREPLRLPLQIWMAGIASGDREMSGSCPEGFPQLWTVLWRTLGGRSEP